MVHVLDLEFLGIDHAIASFLIETSAGPVLVETGPHSTFGSMEKKLQNFGYRPEDIKHVLLTHIHFDHAGAAWAF
ncbi:MAG: MBL fold metallo-hydrolase, partial [Marinoscillum sp.]